VTEPSQASEAGIEKRFGREVSSPKCVEKLASSRLSIPLETEPRERLRELREIGFVGSAISAWLAQGAKRAAGTSLNRDARQITDLMIKLSCASVERLVVNCSDGGFEDREKRTGHIAHMHDWPPWAPVAIQYHLSGCHSGSD
jgi:hypothetical protein